MASAKYLPAMEDALGAGLNLASGDVRVMLVKSTYTFSAAHGFVSDVVTHDNGRSGALTGKTVTNGVFDADDTTLVATAAAACNALIYFKHTGTDATARLLSYTDTATGLPFTPAAGQTCAIQHDAGANKIFAL